jgi:broad specificity phosphatase PhoE
MARLHLVRHGEAAAGFGADHDPGLSALGRAQAEELVDTLSEVEPCPVISSPLLRCRETALPLASAWGTEASIEPAIAEVASPSADLAERSAWLRVALASRWTELEAEPVAWRDRLLQFIRSASADAVLVTHFVVVNAVIGAATGDDRVMSARVANGSVTVVDVDGGELRLVTAGDVGRSEVL